MKLYKAAMVQPVNLKDLKMAVFQQNKQLNQLFKDAAQKGYVLSFTDEDGTFEEVKNAQEFLDLATDFELCFLWVKKNNQQNLFIGFISEYNPVVKDIEISVFNHSYDEELQQYFQINSSNLTS